MKENKKKLIKKIVSMIHCRKLESRKVRPIRLFNGENKPTSSATGSHLLKNWTFRAHRSSPHVLCLPGPSWPTNSVGKKPTRLKYLLIGQLKDNLVTYRCECER